MKESASLPVIRETLHQYINLIKNLTGQTIMTEMSSEIQELILAEKGLKLLKDCQAAASKLYEDVGNRFEKAFAQKYKHYRKYRDLEFSKNGADLKVIIESNDGIWIGYMGFIGKETHNGPFINA